MKIRLMTIGAVPIFTEYGVSLNHERWTSVDVDKLTPDDRRGLVAVHKRIVVVHEADEQAFANVVASLQFEDPPKPADAPAKKK